MYERLGGMAFFETLTQHFYDGVASDEVLRPLYPEDLDAPRRHLCLFLAQFWGGPRVYDLERGSPNLRARHSTFRIGPPERDRWLMHMTAALRATNPKPLEQAQMLSQFEAIANHLSSSAAR
jgi:hemoglobin